MDRRLRAPWLSDRIEALGGRFGLESPFSSGTVVRAAIPVR